MMNFTEKFYKEKEMFMKNILVTDDKIMSSDEDYDNKDTFLSKLLSNDKSMLDTHIIFEYSQISKFVLFEDENGIQIFFKNKNKEEKTYLQFEQATDYQEVLEMVKNKCPHLQPSEERKGNIFSLIKPLLYTVMALAFACSIVLMAVELENKGVIVVSGRRSGLKYLFANMANFLGIYGSVIAGILIVAGFVIYTYRVYKKSKKTYVAYK